MTITDETIAISVKQAAALVNCSTTYLYHLAKAGELPGAYRMGSRWFVAVEPFRAHFGISTEQPAVAS